MGKDKYYGFSKAYPGPEVVLKSLVWSGFSALRGLDQDQDQSSQVKRLQKLD
jgi:hypothetical protein